MPSDSDPEESSSEPEVLELSDSSSDDSREAGGGVAAVLASGGVVLQAEFRFALEGAFVGWAAVFAVIWASLRLTVKRIS